MTKKTRSEVAGFTICTHIRAPVSLKIIICLLEILHKEMHGRELSFCLYSYLNGITVGRGFLK